MKNRHVALRSSIDTPKIAASFAGVVLIAGALVLHPASAGSTVSDMAPDFASLDADEDGALSEKEWMESEPASMMSEDMAAAHFSMYDADGNDSVSAEEYERVNRAALGEQSDPI